MDYPVRLALGSNLGDRGAHLESAREQISSRLLSQMISSPIHETEPVGPPQGKYFNQVVKGYSSRTPQKALEICLEIELGMGRERNELWGPRTIDIDILTFGEFHMEDEFLKIPHPRLSERRFVLGPWADLEPDFNIPVWGKTVQELLNALPSSLEGSPG